MLEMADGDDPYDEGSAPVHRPARASGGPTPAAAAPAVSYVPVAIRGKVFADVFDEFTIVTNVITHEATRLNGEWQILFGDDDLDAVLYQAGGVPDDVGIKELDDLLRQVLVRRDQEPSTSEELFVKESDGRIDAAKSL